MRKISLSKLDVLFGEIAANYALYLPVDTKAGAKFERWEAGKTLSDALNTVRSAKDFFFPQMENLMDFKMEGKNIEVIDTRSESEDFVIFGVRACDVKSFEVLDRVFLSEPADTYYQNRREHGVILSMACTKPVETCFCGTFGIDAASPEGDVVCHKTEDALYLDAKTEKGQKLMAALESVTQEADASAVDAQKELIRERMAKLPLANLSADAFGDGKTSEFFGAPEWSELRDMHLRLPDLPMLRYQRFQHRPWRQAVPLLGFLHVFRVHKNVCRPASADADGAVPPALHA